MKHAHTRHLRCTRPAEQRDALSVIKSIDRADFIYSICIFSALVFVAGAVLAMGAGK